MLVSYGLLYQGILLHVLTSFKSRHFKLSIDITPMSVCWVFAELHQSLFKTSPVTRWPSLKCLSGIQVQLLSLCMGKHQILQNCSLSLRLNFIFEITNEIGQQLCHKCCFFCSNSIIKSLFLRLDQPVRMCSPERVSQSADCFYSNRDFWLYQLVIGSFIQKAGLPAIERSY